MPNNANKLPFSGDSYFAAGSPGAAFYISYDDWERSLFHGLLLQPHLHALDTSLFSTTHVQRHLDE